jgi:primosomal protein N' (replication factor Y)
VRYAQVLIDLPVASLRTPLHYQVPPALEGVVSFGARVVVPLSRRLVPGFVVGFDDSAPALATLPIADVLGVEVFFDEEIWDLAKWVADRYLATPLEALRCAIPSDALAHLRRRVVRAADPLDPSALTEPERALLGALGAEGADEEDLARTIGRAATRRALARMRAAGWVDVRTEMRPPAVSPGQEVLVRLAVSPDVAWEVVERSRRRAPRRARVLGALMAAGEASRADLARDGRSAALRALLRDGIVEEVRVEAIRDPLRGTYRDAAIPAELTREQQDALRAIQDAVDAGRHEVLLLHGVTGSGKTEVYLRAVAHVIERGQRGLILVPEIALTPQTVARFAGRFADRVAVLHSRLSAGERYDTWRRIRRGDFHVVVGARSAVFAPLPDIGLIVVDEEHEAAYKQSNAPRYHARDVAMERARRRGVPVVLGSATPSVESLWRGQQGVWRWLRLRSRVASRPLPMIRVADMRAEDGRGVFGRDLIDAMRAHVAAGDQILLYLNRRGYASALVCRECGHVPRCHGCGVALTYHLATRTLRCHYCGRTLHAPSACPSCRGVRLRPFGPGTQRVEEEVRRLFPEIRVVRADRDTMSRRGAHQRLMDDLRERRVQVLVGTQMIAKGLDLPGVGFVGVVAADVALSLPDFRAAERTLQQLTQVAGRAGRGDNPGEVIVQTYQPQHPAILAAQRNDDMVFFEDEITSRRTLRYPPFASLVNIILSARALADARQAARSLAAALRGTEVLGPSPAPLNRLRSWYRWQIVARGADPEGVCSAVRDALAAWQRPPGVRVVVDVDPVEML